MEVDAARLQHAAVAREADNPAGPATPREAVKAPAVANAPEATAAPDTASLRLAFVGDVGLSARVTGMLRRDLASEPAPAFVQLLRSADLSFANLEVPLLGDAAAPAGLKIRGRAEDAAWLPRMGVHVVSLANNHIMDAGVEGLASTREALRAAGIQAVGAGDDLAEALEPAILERNGIRIGWLAFADGRAATHHYIARQNRPGAAPIDRDLIKHGVAALRPSVDLLCVSFHQGVNYVRYASPRQREFSRVAADAGADLVVGHHPHVLQGWERMGNTLVFHSLGELLWDAQLGNVVDPRWAEVRRQTAVLTMEWTRGVPPSFRFHPFHAADDFGITPLAEDDRRKFDARMAEISSVYDHYDPQVYLQAADNGVVEHWMKVARYNLRHGNIRYFTGILSRVRGRHLLIGWTHLKRRLRRRR